MTMHRVSLEYDERSGKSVYVTRDRQVFRLLDVRYAGSPYEVVDSPGLEARIQSEGERRIGEDFFYACQPAPSSPGEHLMVVHYMRVPLSFRVPEPVRKVG